MKENMEKIQQIMTPSISEVFEKIFFILLDPSQDEYKEYDMEATIRFEGAIRGGLRLLVSRDMADAMVENMLDLTGDEITLQIMEDCLKETANMVCGNFLKNFDGTDVFDLSAPGFKKKAGGIETGENICRMDFRSDSGEACLIAEIS